VDHEARARDRAAPVALETQAQLGGERVQHPHLVAPIVGVIFGGRPDHGERVQRQTIDRALRVVAPGRL
jgi:hypothetical protein